MDLLDAVRELVKNSIDAQCTTIQIELNKSLDLRIIDDGCGLNREILRNVGERPLFISNALRKDGFRYGKNGKSLFTMAQITNEIYIETIKQNSKVRFFKRINTHKSEYEIYESDREYKDAMIAMPQGTMIVLNNFVQDVNKDTNFLKTNMIKTVVELALINFEIRISIKDSATQNVIYESFGTVNLFRKFQDLLQANQFFSKIHHYSCQKHNVKVDLFLCENKTSSKTFQFVYFNKLIEPDLKWTKFTNDLCKMKFENDLNSNFAVYVLDIRVEDYMNNQLVNNVLIGNCIKKCFEQMSSNCNTAGNASSEKNILEVVQKFRNEDFAVRNGKKNKDVGVPLGDWIFNNSCENIGFLKNRSEVYRKKICENWVISLDQPKPKNPNDSLISVATKLENSKPKTVKHSLTDVLLGKAPENDAKFKKPLQILKTKIGMSKKHKEKSSTYVFSQEYQPSHSAKRFHNSTLLRKTKKLITNRGTKKKPNRKPSRELPIESRLRNRYPEIAALKVSENDDWKELNNNQHYYQTSVMSPVSIHDFNNSLTKRNSPLNLTSSVQKTKDKFYDHFEMYRSKETLGFKLQKNDHTTSFNMTFSSSIAIHTMIDPFADFFENDFKETKVKSKDLFENLPNVAANNPPLCAPQSERNRRQRSFITSQNSQLNYHSHRNNSFQSQYTFCHLREDFHRSDIHFGEFKSPKRPKFIQSSSNTETTVSPMSNKKNSSIGVINEEVRQTGWPVTININFGQGK